MLYFSYKKIKYFVHKNLYKIILCSILQRFIYWLIDKIYTLYFTINIFRTNKNNFREKNFSHNDDNA